MQEDVTSTEFLSKNSSDEMKSGGHNDMQNNEKEFRENSFMAKRKLEGAVMVIPQNDNQKN